MAPSPTLKSGPVVAKTGEETVARPIKLDANPAGKVAKLDVLAPAVLPFPVLLTVIVPLPVVPTRTDPAVTPPKLPITGATPVPVTAVVSEPLALLAPRPFWNAAVTLFVLGPVTIGVKLTFTFCVAPSVRLPVVDGTVKLMRIDNGRFDFLTAHPEGAPRREVRERAEGLSEFTEERLSFHNVEISIRRYAKRIFVAITTDTPGDENTKPLTTVLEKTLHDEYDHRLGLASAMVAADEAQGGLQDDLNRAYAASVASWGW